MGSLWISLAVVATNVYILFRFYMYFIFLMPVAM